jgi:hypothetical protein
MTDIKLLAVDNESHSILPSLLPMFPITPALVNESVEDDGKEGRKREE